MCGIAGLANWGDSRVLARMTEIQAHRGPDDAGVWEHHFPDGGYVGLGSRRLAIIDLSPAGHMPMSNEQGTVWIVYNGETYNFAELRRELEAKGRTFRSNTDTEVVLQLYEEEGPDSFRRLNGIFALAICDLRSGTLVLARDHFGIKPLYYTQQGRRLAFATEIKALLEVKEIQASVDPDALQQYLTFLWVPDPGTMFSGIQKLPAGHYATFRDGRLDTRRYWDLTFPPADARFPIGEEELVDQIRARFRRSVRGQMVSDVPIGAFLSAGLDSSSIVAMMAEASPDPIRTYTIAFPPKNRIGENTLDDPAVAARVAKRFGCDHTEIVVEPRVADLLPNLVWHMDEPTADPAIIMAYLVCREAKRTSTVVLSGVGGDELFGGYRKYAAHYWSRFYRGLPSLLRRSVIEPGVAALPSLRGTRFKGPVRLLKKMVRGGSLAPRDAFLMSSTYLTEAQKAWLLTPGSADVNGFDPTSLHREHFDRVRHADFLNQMLYVDTKTFMVSLNLTYNDKMSMASSVEVRVPFLDWELAEYVAWNVPPRLKLHGTWRPTTKHIFRKAMAGILPDEVLRQPKAGFGAPVDSWLASDLREMVDDLLAEDRVRRRGYFVPSSVRQMLREQRAGMRDWSLQIWQLLTFELWLQTFVDAARPTVAEYSHA